MDNNDKKINKISIIIPVYNGANVICDCLSSIAKSVIDVPYEIIVIDDGSTDNTKEIALQFPCVYIKIIKSGVAKARNIGIKKASGDILLFFDADVILKEDTLRNFINHFEKDTDAYIIQGRWEKNYPSSSFSTQFLLLRFAYNFESLFDNEKRLRVAELMTGCLGMRKEVFEHFKGCNESYKFAGGEEFEFGSRLIRKYDIFYYPDISVFHKFGSLLQTAKKVYFRTTNYSMIVFNVAQKGEFVNLTANSAPNRDRNSVIIVFLFMLNIIMFYPSTRVTFLLYIVLSLIYMINVRSFILYLFKEKGLLFALKGGVSDLFITTFKLFGLLKAVTVYYILRQKNYKI